MKSARLVSAILGLIPTLAGLLLLSIPAYAADFRFLVPYRFEGIHPSVNSIVINCVVWADNGDAIGNEQHWVSLVGIPLSESGYKSISGMATILAQRALTDDRPARWRCSVNLMSYTRTDGSPTLGAPTPTGTVEALIYREGSNIEERGDF